jgi:hypothetical protein
MKQQLLIITPHSFVDLITNSSTELFVCSTKKSVEMVEELLKKLLLNHNEMLDTPNQYVFSEIFKPVEIAKYTYDKELFSKDIVANYHNYHWEDDNYKYVSQRLRPDSYIQAEIEENKLRKEHPAIVNRRKYEEDETKEEQKKREEENRDYWKQENRIWTQVGVETLGAEVDLFIEFLKLNKAEQYIDLVNTWADKAKEDHLKEQRGKFVGLHRLVSAAEDNEDKIPKELAELFDFFTLVNGYEFSIHKGQILIYSANDNTIPYSLFEQIAEYFSARRYHIG